MVSNNDLVPLIKDAKVMVGKVGLYNLQNVVLASKNEVRKMLNGLVKLVFFKEELPYSKATNQRQSGFNNPLDPVKCAAIRRMLIKNNVIYLPEYFTSIIVLESTLSKCSKYRSDIVSLSAVGELIC